MTDPELPKLALPGDYLGAAEQFLPGRGTYEDRGRIYASILGQPAIDPRDRTLRIEPRNAVPEIGEEDLVTATSRRSVPGKPEGTVHISKAKDGYTETLQGEFAVGDIILARVLQARPSIKLTTAAATLGVVAARCQVCHALLTMGGKELVCPRCGHTERRKLAKGPRPFGPGTHEPTSD